MSGSSLFPRDERGRGYDPAAVDAYLERARASFEADEGDEARREVDAAAVRAVGFPLVRGGYSVDAVDMALTRIEEAFAAREREEALARAGARPWVARSRGIGQEILDRMSRPEGARFRRAGLLRYGYRVDEVDIVADRIAAYLETGAPLTVEQVRTVAFRMQRRGYDEAQVDAVLDALIEIMLAVR
ncbi:DivIVA domain-containing protein [Microbacterium sp. No. 7]|uniref:DivIVA domain-containing protein n=1 Tax=Microbacterium sp. No. 7 TaxID=1714373 RepID=UPI0006D07922|nr:DivIVA domain-containing protein [Microbacterium sp. No. 7]ALJ20300.1 MFS transporter permease [Microbacterium sp. No. 7]